jgi:hypothetical protein
MISNDRRNKGPEVWIVAGQAESGPVLLRVYPGAELTVRVVSELDRAPIEGAEVSGFYPFVRRETDADGLASFDGLIPEDRRVTARAEGYLSRGAAAGLAAGEHAFIEIPLAPTGSIHGRISDVDGNPIEGARVYPSMPVGERIDQISLMTRSRPSDPEGFYRMSGLPLETPIDLQVSANGHSQKVVRYVRIPNEERLTRVDFELEKGESREPAAELLGSVEGVVVDMNGAPIAGASVTADARTAVATDASGRFRFDGVAHSPIHITSVTARAAGFAPQRVEYVPGPPESPPFVTIEMNPGHWIGGRVVDARGNPLADAIVEVEGAGGDRRTGLDGSFYIDSLPESVTFGFQRSWFSPQSVSKKSFQAASC